MEVTAEILRRAKMLGACNNMPVAGAAIEQCTFEQLVWAESHSLLVDAETSQLPRPACLLAGRLPLWAFSGYGYGDGSGSGSGSGYGDGSGSGYGDGYGDGR